jgi:hypothetical protein
MVDSDADRNMPNDNEDSTQRGEMKEKGEEVMAEAAEGNSLRRCTARALEEKWEESFNKLLLYREKHGNCNVPSRHPDDPNLGTWGKSSDVMRILTNCLLF